MKTVAALYVQTGGCYFGLEGCDPWDEKRDARLYDGPHPVVAHPPCERWGRYWFGGPSVRVRKELGDDGGCFALALAAVQLHGGVLEHPAGSKAWREFRLTPPRRGGGWTVDRPGVSFVCEVEQGHYGHLARKKTWLYWSTNAGRTLLPSLTWGGSSASMRLDEGFHSSAERVAARAAGVAPRRRLTKQQNAATPVPFRDLLLSLARLA